MKVKTTVIEVECNAEELRQSNSLSDSFWGALRRAFNGGIADGDDCESEDDTEEQ